MSEHRFLRSAVAALVALLAFGLLATACSASDTDSASDSDETGEDGTGNGSEGSTEEVDLAALAAAVEEPGPWAVGTKTVEVTGARGRTLPTQVWYPVDTEVAADAEPAVYEFPGIEVPSGAVAGAPPADGEFPLVIYSHGNNGLRYVSSFMTEHLASHGFVVMAPDHTGNTAIDNFLGTGDETEQSAADRPADVAAVIDAAEAGVPGLEDVVAVTDTDRVAVTGHSFGGYTALVAAGGTDDIESDERVDAIIGLAPASSGIPDDSLEAVDVPTLLVSGTLDETTPVEEDTIRPAELVQGRPLVRADIEKAGHQSFADVCVYLGLVDSLPDLPAELVEAVQEYAEEGCAEELIDYEEAQRLTNRLATAFLLDSLYGDADYVPLLAPPADEDQPLAVLDFAA